MVKEKRRFVIFIIISFFNLSSLFGLGVKEPQSEFERTAESPSGKYNYLLENKDASFILYIYEDKSLIFFDDQLYRRQDRFFITWHEECDILWLYSGDIGTYYFYFEKDKWNKGTFSDGRMKNIDIPIALKNAVPRLKNY